MEAAAAMVSDHQMHDPAAPPPHSVWRWRHFPLPLFIFPLAFTLAAVLLICLYLKLLICIRHRLRREAQRLQQEQQELQEEEEDAIIIPSSSSPLHHIMPILLFHKDHLIRYDASSSDDSPQDNNNTKKTTKKKNGDIDFSSKHTKINDLDKDHHQGGVIMTATTSPTTASSSDASSCDHHHHCPRPHHNYNNILLLNHLECSICLSPFLHLDKLRIFPSCLHPFHASCIDVWLRSNPSCPLCRSYCLDLHPLRIASTISSPC